MKCFYERLHTGRDLRDKFRGYGVWVIPPGSSQQNDGYSHDYHTSILKGFPQVESVSQHKITDSHTNENPSHDPEKSRSGGVGNVRICPAQLIVKLFQEISVLLELILRASQSADGAGDDRVLALRAENRRKVETLIDHQSDLLNLGVGDAYVLVFFAL